MGSLKDRFLQRIDGFMRGDGVKDSAVYFDNNTLYVDVVGNAAQGAAPAFLVRGLDNQTNAPTDLFRVNKDGSSSLVLSGGGTPGTLSNVSLISPAIISPVMSGGTWTGGTLSNVSLINPAIVSPTMSGGSWTTATLNNVNLFSPAVITPVMSGGTWTGGILTGATLSNPNLTSIILLSASLNAPIVTAGSFSAPNLTNANLFSPTLTNPIFSGSFGPVVGNFRDAGAQVFNILAFGATGGPSFNNTSAIAAAASAAYAATGGAVYVPGGRYLTQQIVLGNRVSLIGAGMRASELVLIASQSVDMVVNHQSTGASDPNGKFITVANLTLNGNKAAQASGHGIKWTAPTPGSEPAADDSPDCHNLVSNVYILNPKNDGFTNTGASEHRWFNVHIEQAGANGASPGYDTWISDCTAEKCGKSGFLIGHGSLRMQNCKAFYSGTLQYSSNGIGAGFQISGAGADGAVSMTNCEAQDNGMHGFSIINSRSIAMLNCAADSNGWGAAGSLQAPGTLMAIDAFDMIFSTITGFKSIDRGVNHGAGVRVTQKNAFRMRGSGAATSGYNYVQGTHCGMVAAFDASMGPPVNSIDTNTPNSTVIWNGNSAASALVTSGSAYFYTT